MSVSLDAKHVEIDQHRWYATILVTRTDDSIDKFFICSEAEHSGLWIGDPDDHEEH